MNDRVGQQAAVVVWVALAMANWVVLECVFWPIWSLPKPGSAGLRLTNAGATVLFVYEALVLLALVSHFQAATTHPGCVEAVRPLGGLSVATVCKLCDFRWKPVRAHHCTRCGTCVYRMDHHCQWINNCVGFANQKLFFLFLVYLILAASATVLLLLYAAIIRCELQFWLAMSWSRFFFLMLAGIVALLAGITIPFAGDFVKEQIQGISENQSVVESHIGVRGKQQPFVERCYAVFGRSVFLWPVPCAARLQVDGLDSLEGLAVNYRLSAKACEELGIAGPDDEMLGPPEWAHKDNADVAPSPSSVVRSSACHTISPSGLRTLFQHDAMEEEQSHEEAAPPLLDRSPSLRWRRPRAETPPPLTPAGPRGRVSGSVSDAGSGEAEDRTPAVRRPRL